jgi:hypothetical protein
MVLPTDRGVQRDGVAANDTSNRSWSWTSIRLSHEAEDRAVNTTPESPNR